MPARLSFMILGALAIAPAALASPSTHPLEREVERAAARLTGGPPPASSARSDWFTPGTMIAPAPPGPASAIAAAPKVPGTLGGGGNGFGTSFSPIGDVYRDGAEDFAVGVPYLVQASGDGQVQIFNGLPGGGFLVPTLLNSNQAGCQFGQSVAGAGDVNGDGYPDLLIGAPAYDVGAHMQAGRAFLYLGTAFGYNPAPSWQFDTQEDGAFVGYCVAWAGDVNKDGFDDWLVSAPYHVDGETDEGAIYLFYGGSGPLSTVPAWTQEPNAAFSYYGWSVSTAGDVNADGYADFLVGAPGTSDGIVYQGSFSLFLGSASLPSHVPARTWEGGQVNAQLGSSVSTAGDVNLDGYSDFIVGAPYYTNDQTNEGVAFVYQGGPVPALYDSPAMLERSTPNAQFGAAVSTAGDVNGDGIADVVVGAPLIPQTHGSGAAYLFSGSSAGILTSVSGTIDNVFDSQYCGRSVGTLGDADGDGLSDWAAGTPSPTVSGNVLFRIGQTYITPLDQIAGQGYVPGRTWGVSGATADVDGDGYDDLIIGSPTGGSDVAYRGVITMFRGGPRPFQPLGTTPYVGAAPDWTYEGEIDDAMAQSLSNAGDVNGDGYEDFIAGGYGHSHPEIAEGQALLFYGSPAGPSTTPVWQAEGNQASAYFGWVVAGGGDLNGDGYDDVAVGAPQADQGLISEGLVSVFQGSALGLAHLPVVTLRGNQFACLFGVSAAIVGDINRDGYDDLVVGAHYYTEGETHEGHVFVYLGSSTGVHAPASQVLQINIADAHFGWRVARIGDVNGDGYADIAVGAPGISNGQSNEGEVFVYYGSSGGLLDPAGWSLEGNEADLELGYYGIGSGGDFNGDGYGDFLLGFPQFDGGASEAGRVAVYPGGVSGLSYAPIIDEVASIPGIHLGLAVGGDADFNGDGTTDLFYTAPNFALVGNDEGVVGLRFGNTHGPPVVARTMDRPVSAWRTDSSAPIATGLRSNSNTSFRLKGTGRSAAGRTRLQLEWELKPLAAPFDLLGRARSGWQYSGAVVPGLGSGSAFNASLTGLAPATAYHWRARYKSASPFFGSSRWMVDARRRASERDLWTGGQLVPVAVDPATPAALALAAASPNPFVESATLNFTLPRAGHATLALYDVSGRLVRTVFDGMAAAGSTHAVWDGASQAGRTLPAGAYFARLRYEGEERVTKVLRLR